MDMPTYLTYVEENITKEKLPILYDILEDQELTESIGWDLVQTLLPLLPESEACLIRIATLGNAKEVILKVAENIRAVDFDVEDGEDDPEKLTLTPSVTLNNGDIPNLPLPILQFQILLHMLAILHPRLKVKTPSRFLSASLQAILASYPGAANHHDEITAELVNFVKIVSGPKRPHFPPRRASSAQALATLMSLSANTNAIDTEPSDEDKIQSRLLQSFLTYLLDDYMSSLPQIEGVTGLSWCSRFMEHIQHPLVTSKKVTLTEQFSHSEKLEGRLTTVGQILALAQDIEIHSDELYQALMDSVPEGDGNRGEEDSFPTTASEIPLSRTGALYIFTARKVMEVLNGGPSMTTLSIFPDHYTILSNFAAESGSEALAMSSETLIDSLLFHGLVALEMNNVGNVATDTDYNQYLQITSVLSACLPSPVQRFQAHYLTSTVLRSHPREIVQFEFIQDTLQHCPFENLKTSAVSWIKGLTMEAIQTLALEPDTTPSLFATPAPISSLVPDLFPDLSTEYSIAVKTAESIATIFEDFRLSYSFHGAVLNFLYLLIYSNAFHGPLQVQKILLDGEVRDNFLQPLEDTSNLFLAALNSGGALEDVESAEPGLIPQIEVLLIRCNDITKEAKKLGWWT